MKQIRTYRLKFFLSWWVCLLLCLYSSASAYVLQGEHVLYLTAKKIGTMDALSVEHDIVFYDENGKETEIEVPESCFYRFPFDFKSEINAYDNMRIHLATRRDNIVIFNGELQPYGKSRFDYYKDILLYRERTATAEYLQKLGIDVTISSLGKLDDTICFVIGSMYPDLSVPQYWVEKNSFLPFRLVLHFQNALNGIDIFEIRYLKWEEVTRGFWYPTQIEMYQNNSLARMLTMTNFNSNPTYADHFFDAYELKATYPPKQSIVEPDETADDLQDVQQAIDEFTNIIKP